MEVLCVEDQVRRKSSTAKWSAMCELRKNENGHSVEKVICGAKHLGQPTEFHVCSPKAATAKRKRAQR